MDVWVIFRDDSWYEGSCYRQDFEIIGIYDSEEKASSKAKELNDENGNEQSDASEKPVYGFEKFKVE